MLKQNGLIIVAMLILVPLAIAQDKDAVETRTYDVSDLLRATANYPVNERMGEPGAAPGAFNPFINSQMQPPVNTDALIHLIEDTVLNDTWRDNGGAIGAIRPLGNVLVITQSAAAHDQIKKLLEQLRSD